MTIENLKERTRFWLDNLKYRINAFELRETDKGKPYLKHRDTGEAWWPYTSTGWHPNWDILRR